MNKRSDFMGGGPPTRGEQITGPPHLRLAAGVGVLAVGLLMGATGGVVAVVDPGSAAHGDDGTKASGEQPGAKKAKKKTDGTASTDGTRGLGGQSGRGSSTGAKGPNKKDTDTTDELNDDSGWVAVVLDPVAVVPNVIASDLPNGVEPVPTVVAPVTDAVAMVPNGVATLTNEVARVTDVAAVVPTLVAPVSGVVASVQDMLTPVAVAVDRLTQQLPSDLSSFLASTAAVQPVVGGIEQPVIAGRDGGSRSVVGGVSVASQGPLVLPGAHVLGVLAGHGPGDKTLEGFGPSTFGATTPIACGATTSLGRAPSPRGSAQLAPDGALSMGSDPLLRHPAGQLLVPVSLWELATVAVPGVGGLLVLTAAGVRIGYRQAKAGFALRTAGFARFAPLGPLGDVHSGSLVVVRPRALRVAVSRASSADCPVNEVA